MDPENFPSRLAREAIRKYLRTGKVISLPPQIPKEFQKQAGAFVSLHERGKLRGCIGTYLPQQKNVASEIVKNAINELKFVTSCPNISRKQKFFFII